MKNLTLKHSILFTTCSIIGVIGLIATLYLAQSALKKSDAAYLGQLLDLTRTSAYALKTLQPTGGDEESTRKEAQKIADQLLSAPNFKTVSIVNRDKRVIGHAGTVQTPPVAPSEFPNTGNKLLEFDQLSVLVQAISSPNTANETLIASTPETEESGAIAWLIVEADRTQLVAKQRSIIRLATAYFLCTLVIAVILANYIFRRIETLISSVAEALQQISQGAINIELSSNEYTELKELEEHLNFMAHKLSHYRSDMREEIEQTTEDLRETLETIEIQNVELDIARKEAINADRAKSDFLANMSHEIRTPLNGIVGFTKLLQRSPLNSGQRDHLSSIKKSSEILLTIINDILDFSKIEAGQLDLEEENINLREIVDDVVTMLAPTAHQKNLELVSLYYSDVPTFVKGDSLRIKQVITNLANNAIKFTESGEVVIRVMLDDSLGLKSDNLKISVTDTGVGLTKHEQLSIFKAFSQADASTARQFGGTGLGLSICRALIQEMNGDIKFDSDFKQGSCFWFAIPLIPCDAGLTYVEEAAASDLEVFVFEPKQTAQTALTHILESCAARFSIFENIKQLAWQIESHPAHKTSKNALKTAEHDKLNIAIISLDADQVGQPEYVPMIKRIRELGWRVLIMTPTLDRYGSAVINEASAHLIKPATLASVMHAFEDLANPDSSPSNTQVIAPYRKLSSPHTILATDDNDINLSLIKSLIENLGLSVELANNGFEALEKCQRKHYPLILMDIQMPEMDGVACMKEIRNLDSYTTHGNIIALTAYALPKEKEEFINQGFQSLITKPIDENTLIQTLLHYLPDCEEQSTTAATRSGKEKGQTDKGDDTPKASKPTYEDQFAYEGAVFDWNESVYLCNGNETLAKEFSEKLFSRLPENKTQLHKFFAAKDLNELESAVHKLHGTCHYCGVPRLRSASKILEHALKTHNESVTTTDKNVHHAEIDNWLKAPFKQLIKEIDLLLDWYEQDSRHSLPHSPT
jgi:two-component system, NarL family, sensor histidine kinase BarA